MTCNYRNYTGHPHTITTKREERCECDQCLAGFRCVIQRMVSITYNHTCRPLQKLVPRVCYSRCLETNLGAGWLPNIWKYSPPLAVTAEWRPVLCYLALPVNVKVDTTVPCYRSLYSRQEVFTVVGWCQSSAATVCMSTVPCLVPVGGEAGDEATQGPPHVQPDHVTPLD